MCKAALLTPNTRLPPSLEMVVSNDCMVHGSQTRSVTDSMIMI